MVPDAQVERQQPVAFTDASYPTNMLPRSNAMYSMVSAQCHGRVGVRDADGLERALLQSAGSRVSAGTTTSGATSPLSAMFGASRLYRLAWARRPASATGGGHRYRGSRKDVRCGRNGWCTHPLGLADDLRPCSTPGGEGRSRRRWPRTTSRSCEIGLGDHGDRRTDARSMRQNLSSTHFSTSLSLPEKAKPVTEVGTVSAATARRRAHGAPRRNRAGAGARRARRDRSRPLARTGTVRYALRLARHDARH